MKIEKDFVELLELLNKKKVKYCIVGAYAVGFYGYPRFTKDMDILVEPTLENGRRIIKALKEFGISSSDLTEKDFVEKDRVIQLGYDPVRVDLLTSLEGFAFHRIWKNKNKGKYGNQQVFFIGWKELIENKRKMGRSLDPIDLENLLVVCDDLDLDFGRLKIRPAGSSGGHLGLRSIIDSLKNDKFARLRIGVGRPKNDVAIPGYVLSPFTKQEKKECRDIIEKACHCCAVWLSEGISKTMNIFNRHLNIILIILVSVSIIRIKP